MSGHDQSGDSLSRVGGSGAESADRDLLQRTAQAAWIVLLGLPCFFVVDLWRSAPRLGVLTGLKLVAAVLAAATILAPRRDALHPWARQIALLAFTAFCLITAASGIVSNDPWTTPFLCGAVTFSVGMTFPWGVGMQGAAVAVASLAILWNVQSVGGGPAAQSYALAGVAVAFLASIASAFNLGDQVRARTRARTALRESETRYRTLFDSMDAAVLLMDGDRFVDCNLAAVRLIGVASRDEIIGKTPLDFAPPRQPGGMDSAEMVRGTLSAAAEQGTRLFEWQAMRPNGETFVAEVRLTPFTLGDRRLFQATAFDITQRKHDEDVLRAAQARLEFMVENAGVGFWDWDLRTGETHYSASWRRQLGYAEDEFRGSWEEWWEVLHPGDRERAIVAVRSAVGGAGKYETEFRLRNRDGSYRHVLSRGVLLRTADGQPARILGAHVDITERKQLEDALRRSEEQYRHLVEDITEVIYAVDQHGTVTYMSPVAESLFATAPAAVVEQHFSRFVFPADLPQVAEWFRDALCGRPAPRDHRIVTPSGEVRWVRNHSRPIVENGEIVGLRGVLTDVTERKRMEEDIVALNQSLERRVAARTEELTAAVEQLRLQGAALESAADSIMITDREGRITLVNPAFTRITGYTAAEALGQNPRLLKSGEHDAAFYQLMWQTIQAGRVYRSEITNRRKDGRLYHADLVIAPVRDPQGEITHFVEIEHDITERKQADAELRQAQKLEAIGRLAGGVAHDFNNLLAIIGGCAQFILRSLPADDQSFADAQHIIETVDRGVRLVRQLFTFGRRGPIDAQPVNLTDLITETEPMLRLVLGTQIPLRMHCAPDLAPVRVDRSQIEQIVMNLVGNARDALVAGGEPAAGQVVTIETANVDLAHWPHAIPEGVRPGHYVVLVVSDNGPGMLVEVRDHVFEPFFTTKDFGKGTGLGLATVYGIVKQHGGYIACTSEPGRGTRFEIYFPRDDRGATR